MGNESMSKSTFVKGLAAAVVVAASLGTMTVGEYAIKSTPDAEAAFSETALTESSTAETAGTELVSETLTTEAPETEATGAAAGTEETEAAESESPSEAAVTVIGGADGPTSIFLAGKLADDIAYMEPETYETVSESPEGPFTAGTYSASAAGISSDVAVTMTFDETRILSMDVDVSGEPHGKGSLIDTEITKRILAAQTAEVDGVSGATVTSDAIRSAVADCIAQAQGAAEPETEFDTESESELLTPAELSAISETVAEAEAESESESELESELLTAAELAAAED